MTQISQNPKGFFAFWKQINFYVSLLFILPNYFFLILQRNDSTQSSRFLLTGWQAEPQAGHLPTPLVSAPQKVHPASCYLTVTDQHKWMADWGQFFAGNHRIYTEYAAAGPGIQLSTLSTCLASLKLWVQSVVPKNCSWNPCYPCCSIHWLLP